MIKKILTMAALAASLAANSAFLPTVSDAVELNKWTRDMEGALAASSQSQAPVLLVMLNLDDNGAGCSHCRDFVNRTINSDGFAQMTKQYSFYMVFLNCYGADFRDGKLRKENGDVEGWYFSKWWGKYKLTTQYPLVAIITPDGKRHAAWHNDTVPTTRAPIFVQTLAAEMSKVAPGTGYIPPEPEPEPEPTPAPAPASLRGNIQLVAVDAQGFVSESHLMKLLSKGKWTLKTTNAAGTSTTVKGTYSSSGGTVSAVGPGVQLTGNSTGEYWYGTVNGKNVCGAKIKKLAAGSTPQGQWNMAVRRADGSGYSTTKVAISGRVTFSCKIMNRISASAAGYAAIFPAAAAQTYCPALAGRGDVIVVPLFKRNQISGGCVLFGNQTAGGSFTMKGFNASVLEGSKWTKPSLAVFDNAVFSTYGGGDVRKTLSATATRVKVLERGAGTVTVNKQTGLVKASYKNGRRNCRGSGAAYLSNGQYKAYGGGTETGAGAFTLMITR